MTKRNLINHIMELNPTATPDFLARFNEQDLGEYLQHLQSVSGPAPASITRDHIFGPELESETQTAVAVLETPAELQAEEPASLPPARNATDEPRKRLSQALDEINGDDGWLF
jgi:hypothetical protein